VSPPAQSQESLRDQPTAKLHNRVSPQRTVSVRRRDRAIVLGQWIVLGSLVGSLWLCLGAFFVASRAGDGATRSARDHRLHASIAGLGVGWIYERFGQSIKAGNTSSSTPFTTRARDPLRMAPMVLIGTVMTHLFGGSAGREGTAVQMGASMTDWLSHRLRVGKVLRRQMLGAGVAGGFGSIFGTPIAGAVFGLEFIVLGRIEYTALVPALVASISGDMTTRALGYRAHALPNGAAGRADALLLLKWMRLQARSRSSPRHSSS